jgi:Zn-dependent protease with chaperone function
MSLLARAVTALLLVLGFYSLALALAGILLWFPYYELKHFTGFGDTLHWRVALNCVTAAGIILWSMLPRRDRFEAPGPKVDAGQNPRLFIEISAIAQALKQRMPDDVYLTAEVNAWVAHRGGMLGFGRRRVLALGMPLMTLLTVSQFRAVLAHEFGHYHRGDTVLAPWIYQTRSAILRTLGELEKRKSVLSFLFNWYGHLFVHITQAISRAQEFAADELAARLGGAKALTEGLKQLHMGEFVWGSYLEHEVFPVFAAGYRPPVSMGFARFMQVPGVRIAANQNLEWILSSGDANPLDSHPPLAARIAALTQLGVDLSEDTTTAADLFDRFDIGDASIIASGSSLTPVGWAEVINRVWIPTWQRNAERQSEALQTLTAANLHWELYSGALRGRLINPVSVWMMERERAEKLARNTAGCALALALMRDGWMFNTPPDEMLCEKNGCRMEPMQMVQDLADGELTAQQWAEICTRAGILKLSLALEDTATLKKAVN